MLMKLSQGLAAALLVIGLTAPATAQPVMNVKKLDDLGNGLYAFLYGPYRNIFLVSDQGIIATDPLSVEAAAAVREEMRKITDQPVKYVMYSHSHWDHAAGGQIFKDEGAEFVAQEECLVNMRETPHPDAVFPDITYRDSYKVTVGDQSLEAFYFGPSHDDCMVVMIARPANVLFTVDIANPPSGWIMEFNPVMSDTELWNMVDYLKSVEDLVKREGIETVVGGHMSLSRDAEGRMGIAGPIGPVSAVEEKRLFWETLIGAVRAEMEQGTYAELVPEKLDRSGFKDKIIGYDHDQMSILLRRIASLVASGR